MENLAKQSLSYDEIKEKLKEFFSKEWDEHEHADPVETKANLKKPPVIIRCEICSTEFINANIPEEHLDEHDLLYSCKTCGANLKLTLDFIDHLWEQNKDKLYKCPLCKFEIKERTVMTSHLQTMHYEFKMYVCKMCKKGINDYSQFLNHKSIHTKDKPFKCNQCGSSFERNNLLRRHTARMHIDNPISCEVCQKLCRNKIHLEAHKSKHDRKPTICEKCGKTLSGKFQLQIHERLHTGEKPYICRFCPKSFFASGQRFEHEKTHTGSKPYICSICEKRFAQLVNLKQHKTTHEPEKSFQCSVCTKQFKSKKGYNVHMKLCKGNGAVHPQVNEEVNYNDGLGQNVLHEEKNPEGHNILNSEASNNYEPVSLQQHGNLTVSHNESISQLFTQNDHQVLSSEMNNSQQNQQDSNEKINF